MPGLRKLESCVTMWLLALSFACGILIVSAENVTLSKHPVFIIISYDGFRYDYMEKTETPFLDKVKGNGVSVPYMRNQFISNTFPNHHTMATGLYIASHGITGNSLYDMDLGKLSGYNDDPGYWNYSSSIIPLYTANELAGDGRHSGAMMWCGSAEPWGPDGTEATYAMKYNGSYPYKERVNDVVSWITDPVKPANLVFMYFDEPDKTGHDFGPESPEVIEKIQLMDNITGYILEKLDALNITDKVNLIFLSDHGMAEIPVHTFIPHYGFVNTNENETVYEAKHGTPVLQLLPNKAEDTERIFEAFQNQTSNYNFSVYITEDLGKTKPNWHYAAPRRVMPILVVADSGNVFEDFWGITSNHTTGTHGYDPEKDMKMYPYFMAMGPMFKKNAVVEPFDNVDIYPFVSLALGLESVAHSSNGTYERMLSLLDDDVRKQLVPEKSGGLGTGAIIGIVVGAVALVIVGVIAFIALRRKRYQEYP